MTELHKHADFEVHESERNRAKRNVNAVIMAVFLVYLLLVVPIEWLDFIGASLSERRQYLEPFLAFVGNAGLAALLAWAVSFLIFTTDPLLRGSSRITSWFRSLFAAHRAKQKYACSDHEARALWFKYFDTWAINGSPNRQLLSGTYTATYGARAILYVQWTLLVVIAAALATMFTHWRVFDTYGGEEATVRLTIHFLVVGVFLAALIAITTANRLPSAKRGATGCWAHVEEVFGRSTALFEQDVLNHASTLAQAFDRVDTLRRELLAGRQ